MSMNCLTPSYRSLRVIHTFLLTFQKIHAQFNSVDPCKSIRKALCLCIRINDILEVPIIFVVFTNSFKNIK